MDANRPDIELTTSVEADELRFGDKPETEVRFHGSPGRESVSAGERTNLPDEVEPGTVYEDVRVDHRIATRLRAGGGTALRREQEARPPRDGRSGVRSDARSDRRNDARSRQEDVGSGD